MKSAAPVFLVGAQRSGSTLLGLLLSSHNDVFMTVNGKLLYYLITWIYRDPCAASCCHLRLDEIAYALRRKPILGLKEHEAAQISLLLEASGPWALQMTADSEERVRILWTKIYSALAQDRAVLGDKYNEYMLQLDEISKIFPNCKFIFQHRNPNDTAESMLRAFQGRSWAPRSAEHAIVKWTAWNRQWIRFREQVSPDRRLEIPYHRFVQMPAKTIAQICSFLNVRQSEELSAAANARITMTYEGLGKLLKIDWSVVGMMAPDFAYVSETLGYHSAL